jgi:hypothetical protein
MSDHEDEVLLSRLRAVATESEPTPDHVRAAAKAAFGLRSLDAELAELVADSLDNAGAARGSSDVLLLSFETSTVTVEVQVTAAGAERRLLGEVIGGVGPVQLDTPDSSNTVELDAAGRFSAQVPAGPVRMRFAGSDGRPIATSWTVF